MHRIIFLFSLLGVLSSCSNLEDVGKVLDGSEANLTSETDTLGLLGAVGSIVNTVDVTGKGSEPLPNGTTDTPEAGVVVGSATTCVLGSASLDNCTLN